MRTSFAAFAFAALAGALAFLPGDTAVAKSDRADFAFGKGKWEVTLSTPFGEVPLDVSLQPNGKGKLWLQGGGRPLPVVHQSGLDWISWTVELPAVQAPDGNGHTIIGRGTLAEDGTVSGNLVIVTLVADAESAVGYETHTGTFAATKKGR
jgi:hypothetical protein